MSDETVVLKQTKTYTHIACTVMALNVHMGRVANQGFGDCWSVCTFQSGFSCLSMYACSMLLCIWCLGVLCTGYPPLGARQPTESWLCMYLCGSKHSRTQHRFVSLSMHCQYASFIEPICVCIAIIWSLSTVSMTKGAKSWIHMFFNSPCSECVAVWHWQDRSVCILPTERLTTHMLRSLQCHHYASSDIIVCLPFVCGVLYVIIVKFTDTALCLWCLMPLN